MPLLPVNKEITFMVAYLTGGIPMSILAEGPSAVKTRCQDYRPPCGIPPPKTASSSFDFREQESNIDDFTSYCYIYYEQKYAPENFARTGLSHGTGITPQPG
jgi:hypothetical protein